MREVVLELRGALMACLGAATVLAHELVRDFDAYGDELEAEAMRDICCDKRKPPSIW